MKTFLNFNKASLPHFLSPIYIILGHCLAIFILVSPFSMLVQLLFSNWCDWKLFVAFCSAIVFILVLFCFSSVFGCAAKLVYVRPVATTAAIHAGIQIKWPRYFSMWIFQFNVCLSGSLCKCAFMWVRCCIFFFLSFVEMIGWTSILLAQPRTNIQIIQNPKLNSKSE